MKVSYNKVEPLGEHLRLVDERNQTLKAHRVLGININKDFMPSVANIIGTDLSKYKVITKGLFACNPMHVGRDERLPIALFEEDTPALISPAYFMFRVNNKNILNEEYLMMWFRRSEFDRQCWLKTDGSVRGGISWEDICRIEIPIIPYSEQLKIVWNYRAISNRIALKQRINDNLEEILEILYKHYFIENPSISRWDKGSIGDVLQLQRGHDLPRDNMDNGIYPVIGSTEIIGHHSKYTTKTPAIVMGRSGNIGNPRIYFCKCWVHNTALYVKEIYSSNNPIWVFFMLKNLNYEEFVGGSAVPTLNRNYVHSFPITIPPMSLQNEFAKNALSLFKNKDINLIEINSLMKMRSLILSTISRR